LKYTVSESRKIYVQDRLEGELFFSREFDDSVTPIEVGFQAVRDQMNQWVMEEVKRLSVGMSKPAKPEATASVPAEEPKPKPPKPIVTAEQVSASFPPDLVKLLCFESTDEYVLIKARHYLGPDNFRKIAAAVKDQLGGEYVSAGKDSHFRIPLKRRSNV